MKTDWTAGYVADIGYTFGYYPELNPLRVKLAFLNAGLVFPEIATACELGFGQGVSVNIHAAATPVQWYGNDFNPAQAAGARELASAAGSEAVLVDESFAEFAGRKDLPEFDYIGVHGTWSWVSDENRRILVDFIRRRLRVGGVLYVSYNTFPGWAAFGPMRHLMREHVDIIGAEGRGIVSRIDDALGFADRLMETNPMFARANPSIVERVKKLNGQDHHYLAHEYFNKDWHPMHFATMAESLSSAKLNYACSAHFLDHIDAINLTQKQQEFLAEIQEPQFRQSVRDFMVNQQFRRDYWVRGKRSLSLIARQESLRELRLVMVKQRSEIKLTITGSLGEANMSPVVYEPILDRMEDYKVVTIAQLEQAMKSLQVPFPQLIEAILVLVGAGHVAIAQDETVAETMRKRTKRLNSYIIDRSRGSADLPYLVSPLTGAGVFVNRFEQLFLSGLRNGIRRHEELARQAWEPLELQGQRILKDGKPLESMQENIEELELRARIFIDHKVPLLKALMIA